MRLPSSSPAPVDPSLRVARQVLRELLPTIEQTETLFGNYVLYEELGRGGFGIVFRAKRVGSDEDLALKQIRGGAHATSEERLEFLTGAHTAARLEHPGIVRVHDVGEVDGCPFFTMDLVAGGNLAAALDVERPCHAQSAKWVQSIALAVHHAHSCELLHRDLKPANILLDERREPMVADFGSARRLGEQGQCVESGEGVLSYYMAPEQATGDARSLTRRADIYSLGVILYELLTGRVPYEELPFVDWVSELVSHDPVRSPRELEPTLSRDLELVCLKCLEKEPTRRYDSAAQLAEDLQLVRDGLRPGVRPEHPLSLALRWIRRRPLRSAMVAGVALVALVTTLGVFSLIQAEEEQQRAALESNAFIAGSEAGALLSQLREFADRAERCAQKPEVRNLLSKGAVAEKSPELEGCVRGFLDIYLAASDGRLLTEWPLRSNAVLGKNYAFRDYFLGAQALAEQGLHGAYLGPAYRAESNGQLQFALAAPVFALNGEWLGSVVAAQAADSAIGQVPLQDPTETERVVALLGPRDRDRSSSLARSEDFDFLVHPQLGRGREVAIQDPVRVLLRRRFESPPTVGEQFSIRWVPPLLLEDYRDPLFDAQRSWLAAFAPVGHTGYVVVVQTSKAAVRRGTRALALKLAQRGGIVFIVGALLLSWGVVRSARRRRSLEVRPHRYRRKDAASVALKR